MWSRTVKSNLCLRGFLASLPQVLHRLVLQRWIGAPDFSSESAGSGLTSLKRKRRTFENAYYSMPFACASGLWQAKAGAGLTSLKRNRRTTFENAYYSMPFACASGLWQAKAGAGLTSLKRKRRAFKNAYRSMPFLRFRLVVSAFPSIVCILDSDRSGAVELVSGFFFREFAQARIPCSGLDDR